jgi:hypothetical protein
MQEEVFQTNHRHVIFTIDEGLRNIFLLHRGELLKEFMEEAARPCTHVGDNGRHDGKWRMEDVRLFAVQKIRKQWQTVVLKLIRRNVTAKEFISRLIRHISDEQFKMIRHYGLYARRIKKQCKEKVRAWQEKVKKTLVKVKKLINRRKWHERIKEQTGVDPMVCPKCESYYEYKGEVCLEEGQLVVKHAVCASDTAVRGA